MSNQEKWYDDSGNVLLAIIFAAACFGEYRHGPSHSDLNNLEEQIEDLEDEVDKLKRDLERSGFTID